MKKYRISEQDLENHLLAGARALRFADLRFRPEVQISDQELRAAYDKYVTAQWRASHTEPLRHLSKTAAPTWKSCSRISAPPKLWTMAGNHPTETHVDYREAAFQ